MRRRYNPAFAQNPPSLMAPRQPLPMGSTMRGTSEGGTKMLLGVLIVGGVVWLLVQGNKQWQSYTPEERADARNHNRQMAMIGAARDILD